MTSPPDRPLEEQIAEWRAYLRRRQGVHRSDVEELEGHLRDQLVALTEAGLSGDEAFLVAVKRMGSVGLKVAMLAQGACDLYLATTVVKEWDMCAPHALLLEAGGKLTDPCGDDILYNKPEIGTCRGLVGSNGLIHTQIVETVAPFLDGL